MHGFKSSVLLLSTMSSAVFAEWQFVGPFGGSADIVRVARSNTGIIVAASRNALIYRSSDSGAKWSRVAFTGEHGSVLHALEIDPADEARWYAGVQDESERISGVYVTTDSGQTWSRLPGIAGKIIWSIAIWRKDPRVIVAGAADGVYRSTDRGETWARVSPEADKALQPVVSLALDPEDSNIIYAGTTHLPWRTANGGETWRSVHSGMLDDSDVFSIVVHPIRRDVIYASACSGAYRSGDSASLWSRLPTPRGTFRTYVVAVDPNTPTLVYAGTNLGLLQSSDEGRTWTRISSHVVKSIDFDHARTGRTYFASTTGGILIRSGHGGAISESNAGFANRTWAAFNGAGGPLFASSVYDVTGGVFRSDNAGANWLRLSGADAIGGENLLLLASSSKAPLTLFGASHSRVWRSIDGGKTWIALTNTPAGQLLALFFIVDVKGGLYLATASGLHKSQDEGKTWQRISLPLNTPIRSVQASGNALSATTDSAIALSRDFGRSWAVCGKTSSAVDWYGIAVNADPQVVMAATSHGLLRSIDNCRTWSLVRSGIEASTVMNVVAHPSRREFFAVQRGRLLRSVDDGESWESLSKTSEGEATPTVLGIFPENPDSVFALFRRRGVARWQLGDSTRQGASVLKPTTQ